MEEKVLGAQLWRCLGNGVPSRNGMRGQWPHGQGKQQLSTRPSPLPFFRALLQDMYEQLAKVRDEQEAASRPGGAPADGNGAGQGRQRIILVSRRLPCKLQVRFG